MQLAVRIEKRNYFRHIIFEHGFVPTGGKVKRFFIRAGVFWFYSVRQRCIKHGKSPILRDYCIQRIGIRRAINKLRAQTFIFEHGGGFFEHGGFARSRAALY